MFCRNQLGIFYHLLRPKIFLSGQLLNKRFFLRCFLFFRIFYFPLNARENSELHYENSFSKTFLVYVSFNVKAHLICGCNAPWTLVTSQMSPNNTLPTFFTENAAFFRFCTVVPDIVYFHFYSAFLWENLFFLIYLPEKSTLCPQTLGIFF